MSKQPPKPSATIKPEVLKDETTALSAGLTGLIPATRTKSGLKKVLADEHARALLTTTLATFVNVDMRFTVGMKAVGEILYNILYKSDEEIQRKALEAICQAQNITSVEFNPRAPRSSFASALFAQFPDMQRQVQGGKDTLGALRLSNYIHAYKSANEPNRRVGSGNESANGQGTTTKPRSAKDLFLLLHTNATMKEKTTLLSIAQRARLDYQDWLPESEEEDGKGKE